MIQSWLRRVSGTPDEITRKVQAVGLVKTANLASTVLRRPGPDADEMPGWIEDILAAVIEQMCGYADGELPEALECGALDGALEFVSGMPGSTREELQSLLVLVELSPYMLGPRRRRFTELNGEMRNEVLRRWEQAPLVPMKGGFAALKSVAMMGYWTQPESWRAIGYSVAQNPGVPEPQKGQWENREEGST